MSFLCLCLFGLLAPAASFQTMHVSSSPSSCVLRSESYHASQLSMYQDDSSATVQQSTAQIDLDENAYRDIPAMEQWAADCGVQRSEGFALTSDDGGYDTYAITTTDLPAQSPVLSVPEAMILSTTKAMEELRSEDMEGAEKILIGVNAEHEIPRYYLMLKLLVELERGVDSPWFAWLNSLPRYYTNAVSMTSFCYSCLPSLMRKLAMEERGLFNHLMVRGRVPFLSTETKADLSLWEFAYQVVFTRAIETSEGSNEWCIVPLGDYFNHGSDFQEIDYCFDDGGNYYAQTTYDVPAGCPLRISYADPTNPSFLFARYGFLDESSLATFCKIFPPHVNKEMEQLGYAQNRMLFYKDGDVSQEVWDILLYQYLSSTKVGDRRELMTAHLEDDWETKQALHEQYYPKTSELLAAHIDTFIGQLDRLAAKTDGVDVNDHPRLPIISAHNDFVRRSFMAVRSRFFE